MIIWTIFRCNEVRGVLVRDLSEEPDPTPYIIGFVVIFLSSIGGYIFYVNSKVRAVLYD